MTQLSSAVFVAALALCAGAGCSSDGDGGDAAIRDVSTRDGRSGDVVIGDAAAPDVAARDAAARDAASDVTASDGTVDGVSADGSVDSSSVDSVSVDSSVDSVSADSSVDTTAAADSSVDGFNTSGWTMKTRTLQDSASGGTPDSYFFDVDPGSPLAASITGGGSGSWTVNVFGGVSNRLYCSGAPSCQVMLWPQDTTVIITAITTGIGYYTLTVQYSGKGLR
ncbi:MAG: hypothetical protein KC503_00920 [Myxococcales bacterium]|nr:hypothetical protein [Myxococcales bacterium]